jgi:glutamate racemase
VGVEPALKPAIALTRTGRVGVMGTQGTLNSSRIEKLKQMVLAEASPKSCEFVMQACEGLALAIEQQTVKALSDTLALENLCKQHLQAMGPFGQNAGQMDTLVLGCTHYVFVEDMLRKWVGPAVQIISTGEAVAKQTHRLLTDVNRMQALQNKSGDVQLWTTGSLHALEAAASRWLNLSAAHCHLAPVDSPLS